MDAVEEMMCVMLQMEHGGDGCDLALSLCKYDLRKAELGKGVTNEAWKYLFRSAKHL